MQRSEVALDVRFRAGGEIPTATLHAGRHRYLILCGVFALAVISGLLLNLVLGSGPDEVLNSTKYLDIVARRPTAWEQYGWSIAGISIAFFLQALLILLFLFERQRRAVAEQEASQFISEAMTVNRRISLGEMSAYIAHELKQPLSAILINTEAAEMILKNAAPSIAELQDIVADIKRDEMRAVEIIDRVRNMIRLAPSPAQTIDLNRCIRDTFRLVSSRAAANDIGLRSELDENLPEIPADAIQIQQVILNITINALDAIIGHGSSRRDIIVKSAFHGRGIVEISIINYGPKVPPQSLSRIFDEYYTTKADGMGLGLAISRKIILAHRGRIWVDNRDDGGVAFHIHLPAMKT
ncbi:sensor histidine kinase [Bosea sp. 2YAB26]|uniref:sensor histidine kinase n=1 Tax=Bosea sp. 2YAB26 TaxID=3237478 RepID=UPI003F90FCFE